VDLVLIPPCGNDIPQQGQLGRKRITDCQHAQSHPDNLDEPADEMVKTIFLHHIAPSILQPMDQNVVTFAKYLETTDDENKSTYGNFGKASCQE
jgi:hypothetical protein